MISWVSCTVRCASLSDYVTLPLLKISIISGWIKINQIVIYTKDTGLDILSVRPGIKNCLIKTLSGSFNIQILYTVNKIIDICQAGHVKSGFKDYQVFDFNGTEAIKHKLNEVQLAEAIAQCNAKSAMTTLLL